MRSWKGNRWASAQRRGVKTPRGGPNRQMKAAEAYPFLGSFGTPLPLDLPPPLDLARLGSLGLLLLPLEPPPDLPLARLGALGLGGLPPPLLDGSLGALLFTLATPGALGDLLPLLPEWTLGALLFKLATPGALGDLVPPLLEGSFGALLPARLGAFGADEPPLGKAGAPDAEGRLGADPFGRLGIEEAEGRGALPVGIEGRGTPEGTLTPGTGAPPPGAFTLLPGIPGPETPTPRLAPPMLAPIPSA